MQVSFHIHKELAIYFLVSIPMYEQIGQVCLIREHNTEISGYGLFELKASK